MKLQKQGAVKTKGKEYFKYVITIPRDRIEALGWTEGIELVDELKNEGMFLRPRTKKEQKKKDITIYEEFKNSIKSILERYPNGLTWTQIRDKMNYFQKFPNNKWTRKLEFDIGLVRTKKEGNMFWALENKTIYTIGYEGMSIEQFIKKLKDTNIQQLIDVREIALSRKNGFSKGILEIELKKVGIRYRHYPSLGSPKDIRHQLHQDLDYKKFFEEYKEHVKDKDVQESIKDVEGLSSIRKTVLLCFEKDFKTCHRSIIAEQLNKDGWKVNHL
jgi:uncharacterized protein YeaO (DUF488 family)